MSTIPNYCWYSASAWEHHTLTHSKENLPIHPNDPAFSQQFACGPGDGATPSTSVSVSNLPHAIIIHRQAEAAKHLLEEGSDQSTFHCPLSEGSGLDPHKTSKHHIKKGPVKSSKEIKESKGFKPKDGDE